MKRCKSKPLFTLNKLVDAMDYKTNFFVGIFITLFFGLGIAQAFPDTIRHGYTNCTSCHVSPSGGGLLNGYGRSLSRELLSTWSYENEEQPLHGFAKIPESWTDSLFVGGDARYLSRKTDSKSAQVDEGFLMQAQMRFGVALGQLKWLMTVGKIENPRKPQDVKLVSPEYYALWNPKEEIYLRAGRFEPIYGLRMPDHNLWAKSEIGFVPWSERDSVEFIYEGESQFASLTGFQSTSAMASSQQMTGFTASFYQVLFETSRVGLSAMNSEGQGSRLKSLSLHWTFTFSDKVYSMGERTRVWSNDSIKDVSFLRFGYEIAKGFTPIIQGQAKVDRVSANADQYKPGLGFIWLPRPHFELMFLAEQLRNSKESSNEGLLMAHYYF